MKNSAKTIAKLCAQAAADKLATNTLIMDMAPCADPCCDFFVICSAESNNQAQAILSHIMRQAKTNGLHKPKTEGHETTDSTWILIDFFDVVVHIMTPEAREFYNIEKLWHDATFYNLNENTGRLRKWPNKQS